ncbi:putative MFS transporter [Lipomyces kononenkoae]|uniref:MFS transporter n=1 Tax=Lipomyces kononenkoae TaxID=34357 RepID=A0ACC3T602_LIPKO
MAEKAKLESTAHIISTFEDVKKGEMLHINSTRVVQVEHELESMAHFNSTDENVKKGDMLHINSTRVVQAEHELGFWKAVRQYPMAVFWAAFFCLAIIMIGYDTQIIASFYALPAFQQRFGYLYQGSYIISAPWQVALSMGQPIGQVLGAFACAWPIEKFGCRITLAACCMWSIGFIFLQFFSLSITSLCIGEIVGGLVFGFYGVIAPTYASEICPLALRGVLTASINLAFVIGTFIAQGCAAGVQSRLDEWSYKIPFAVQWFWPTVVLVGLCFAPESPYWLVRQNRKDDARRSLLRLSSAKHRPDIESLLVMIEETDLLERETEANTSYLDCFLGVNRRRTEISIMVFLNQIFGGAPLIGYVNYFFEQAGLNSSDAFAMGVGNLALGFVGTCISWPLMSYFGRRTIYNWGMILLTIILFIIGFLDFGRGVSSVIWTQASLLDVWTFIYQMTIGPLAFVIISEISSTRLRSRTIAITTAVQGVGNIIFGVVTPYMLNPSQANWAGKTGFLYGGFSFICSIWCWFRVPESRERTFEELDILFEREIPARDFSKYDLLHAHHRTCDDVPKCRPSPISA